MSTRLIPHRKTAVEQAAVGLVWFLGHGHHWDFPCACDTTFGMSPSHSWLPFAHSLQDFYSKLAPVCKESVLNSRTYKRKFLVQQRLTERLRMIPLPVRVSLRPRRTCSCTPPQVEKYLSRISGPLLDRIDLHVEVPAVPFTQLAEMPPGPTSADLRAQVLERGLASPNASAPGALESTAA